MRIATYNVQDLFSETDAVVSGGSAKPAVALKALAGTIGALAADVLLLQEVGSEESLAELNRALAKPYPFLALLPGNSNRGIHLAIMSREPFQLTSHRTLLLEDEAGGPLEEYDTFADSEAGCSSPLRIQRDLMLAELDLQEFGTFALFNVHLKSKTNRDWRLLGADVIRAAESRRIAGVIGAYLQAHPGRPTLLGGDFNDTRSSEPLTAIFALPLRDPLGEGLARTGRNPSTYWPKRRMRLDFLLLSEAASDLLVADSPQIHSGQRARRASDHYPVSLDIDPARWSRR